MKFLKKWLTLIVTVLFIAIIAVLILLGLQSLNTYKDEVAVRDSQIAEMEQSLDEIGECMTVYVVNQPVRSGDLITMDVLTEVRVPEKIAYKLIETQEEVTTQQEVTPAEGEEVAEDAEPAYEEVTEIVTNTERELLMVDDTMIESVIGNYFAVSMQEGTLLMDDYVLYEKLDSTARNYDVTFDYYPLNISVGDYVDIRITFTLGEDFIAIPHHRVERLDLENGIFTFHFTENDMAVWQSMLVDKALYPGTQIYALSYVDSNAQAVAEGFYPINTNIQDILAVDPGIISTVEEEMRLERTALNSALGSDIDTLEDNDLSRLEDEIRRFRIEVNQTMGNAIRERVRREEEEAREAARAAG